LSLVETDAGLGLGGPKRGELTLSLIDEFI
jgi:hypothetical protein